jgi:hypothetical protein
VTLCMMMWHYVWWCDTMYDDLTLCMMMWHYAWWCDTMYDDVTLCMMWHYVWWCDTMAHKAGLLCLRVYVWWFDTMYDDAKLCMMMWHYVWWFDTMDVYNYFFLHYIPAHIYRLKVLKMYLKNFFIFQYTCVFLLYIFIFFNLFLYKKLWSKIDFRLEAICWK